MSKPKLLKLNGKSKTGVKIYIRTDVAGTWLVVRDGDGNEAALTRLADDNPGLQMILAAQ